MNPTEQQHIRAVIQHIAYPGFGFEYEERNGLRVVCEDGVDTRTGEPTAWKGRWWRLSPHMTDGEIVQTAFLAVMTAIEHEAREKFTFLGASVFDPHYDIYALAALRRSPGAIKERA